MMHRLKTKESCKIDDDSDGGQFSTCSYTSLSSVGKNFDPEHERYMKYKNSNENANTPPKENRPALPSYVTPRRLSRSSDISPLNPVRRRLFSDDPNTSEGHIGFRQLEDCFFPIESSNPTDTFDSFETSGGESKQDKLGSLRGRMQNYFNILSPEEQQDDLKRLYNYFIRDRKKSCDTPDTMDSFDYENIDDYYDNSKDRFVSLRKKMHDYFSHLSPGDRQADFKRLYDCFRKQSSSSAGSSWTLDSFDYANIDDFYGVKVTPKKESLKEKMRRYFDSISPFYSNALKLLFFQPDLSTPPKTPYYGNSFRRIFSQPQSPDYSRAFKKLFSVDQRYGLPRRRFSSPSHSRSLNRLFSGSQFTPRYGNSFRRIFSQPQSPDYSRAFKKLFSVDQRYGLPKRSISSPSHSRSLNRLFSGSQFTPRYGNSFRRIFSQPQSPDYSRAFKKLFSVDQRYGLPRRRFSSPSHSLSPDRLFSRSQFTPNYGSAFKNLFSPLSSKLPQIVITEDNIEKSPGLFSGAFFNRQSDQNNNFLTIPSRFHRNKTISVPVPVVQLSPIRHKYPINVMKLLDDDESESEDEDEIPSLEKDPSMEASLRAGSLLEVSPKKKKKGIVKSLSKMFGKKKKDELQGVTSIFRKKKKEPVIESSSGEISILEAMKTTPVQASSSEESSIFERIKKESILGKPFRPTSIFKKKKKEPIKDTFFEEISMFKKDDPVLEVCSEETSSTSEPKEKNKLKKKISSLFKGIGKKREE